MGFWVLMRFDGDFTGARQNLQRDFGEEMGLFCVFFCLGSACEVLKSWFGLKKEITFVFGAGCFLAVQVFKNLKEFWNQV